MAHRGSFPPQPCMPRSPVTVPRWFLHLGSEPCSSLEHQVPGCWSALASPVTCAGEDLGLEELGLQQVRAEVCLASPRVCVGGVCELGKPVQHVAVRLQVELVSGGAV